MARIWDRLRRASIWPSLSSIRFRLTAWYSLILALVLCVFSILVYASQAQSLSARLTDTLRADGQRLAAAYNPVDGQIDNAVSPTIKEGLDSNDILLVLNNQDAPVQQVGTVSNGVVKRLVDVVRSNPGGPLDTAGELPGASSGSSAAINGILKKLESAKQSGEPIDGNQLALLQAEVSHTGEGLFSLTIADKPPTDTSSSNEYMFYTTMLMVNNQKLGTLILGRPREDQLELQRLLLTLLTAAPATLLVAAGGGYWLAGRAMRPVRTIAHTAQQIGETELDRRLNLGTKDELGELAATFDGMLDRLEAAFHRQRQFTADASHELRSPLAIVDLELSHALVADQTPEEYRRALEVIRDETTSMTRLVNDLLVLARADAGHVALRCEELDLSDLALEVVERLEPLARQNGVHLETVGLPELTISGDRLYLSQMLTNLVENAIKYASGPDKRASVETGGLQDGEKVWAWARVEDNGPGIAPEHLPHLFERFYRVDKARSRNDDGSEAQPGGSGLGLSIVQWVAQAHGGRVRVESRVGRGSTFEVLLPGTARQQVSAQGCLAGSLAGQDEAP